jgi:hypothetical protein
VLASPILLVRPMTSRYRAKAPAVTKPRVPKGPLRIWAVRAIPSLSFCSIAVFYPIQVARQVLLENYHQLA